MGLGWVGKHLKGMGWVGKHLKGDGGKGEHTEMGMGGTLKWGWGNT